jgi:hypothetical protein
MKKFFSNFSEMTQTEYTERERLQIMESSLDSESAEAYKTCIKAGDSSRFIMWVKEASQDSGTVTMRWQPQGQRLNRIVMASSGGISGQPPTIPKPEDNVKFDITVNREKGKPFYLTLNAFATAGAGERAHSDTVRVPWVPEVKIEWVLLPVQVTIPTCSRTEKRRSISTMTCTMGGMSQSLLATLVGPISISGKRYQLGVLSGYGD